MGMMLKFWQDENGILWLLFAKGYVSRFNGRSWNAVSAQPIDAMPAVRRPRPPKGLFYLLIDQWNEIGGIRYFDGSKWLHLGTDSPLGNGVRWIMIDAQGHIWASLSPGGVGRFDGQTWTYFTTVDGLAGNGVTEILQDREGNIWFSTNAGATRLATRGLQTFTTDDGLNNAEIMKLVSDPQGALWILDRKGPISQFDGQRFSRFMAGSSLDENYNQARNAALSDRKGYFWFLSRGNLYRFGEMRVSHFTREDGLHYALGGPLGSSTSSLLEDHQGFIWSSAYSNYLSRFDGQTVQTFFRNSDDMGRNFFDMVQDHKGSIWLVGSGTGLVRFDGDTFKTFTTDDGLPSNNIWSNSLQDSQGHLWFGTDGAGVVRYDGTTFQTLTKEDGLAGNVVRDIVETEDGTVWIGCSGGLTRYQPPTPSPPPIHLDAVVADHRYEHPTAVDIPATTGLTVFEFHGLSFKTRPGAMVYRYRLQGHDTEWRNTHAQRIEYEDLAPGRYTFEVIAVDRDAAQECLFGQHVPRFAHADECHHRLHPYP
jgi:hypothetical protein